MEIKCTNCGCDEFVSKPNQYDIYKVLHGKLVFQNSELVDEETKLYCRDCSEELKNAEDLIYDELQNSFTNN